jgi:hypothetical protein
MQNGLDSFQPCLMSVTQTLPQLVIEHRAKCDKVIEAFINFMIIGAHKNADGDGRFVRAAFQNSVAESGFLV